MASAGLIFIGLIALWMAAGVGGPWPLPAMGALGLVAAALTVWAALRLRVADREGAGLFAQAPATAALVAMRLPARVRDGVGVLIAALGGRDRAPVFVRLKLRPADPAAAAVVVAAISGAPGTVVVDADAGSLLAHVLFESDVDVASMQALERAAASAAGGRAP